MNHQNTFHCYYCIMQTLNFLCMKCTWHDAWLWICIHSKLSYMHRMIILFTNRPILMQEWYWAPSITDHEIKVTSSYTTIYKVYIEWDKAGYSEWRINVMCMFITQLCDYFCDEINVETLCICLRDKRLLVLLERLVLPKFKSNKPCIHRNTK